MSKKINIDAAIAPSIEKPSGNMAALKTPKIKKSKNTFEQIESFLMNNYDFRLNEISVEIESKEKGGNEWEVLNESNIHYHLYKSGFKSFQAIVNVLLKSDFSRTKYNPVRTYFNSLPTYNPEIEPDYIDKFLSFIEVTPSETAAFRTHVKKHLVRTVAAAVGVLKFNKQCIVLQGKQNDGKSSLIRYLIPEFLGSKYYTDSFDPESKDDIRRLGNCLIINVDEMAGLSNKDVNKLKSKMSYENVKMRLPYDKSDSDLPRIASFWGTTNENEFLTDSTGSVRWLVFKVLSINHDFGGANGYCSVPIDKIWAQAVYLMKNGFDFKLSDDELKEMDKINRNFQVTSAEQQYLQRYFEPAKESEAGAIVLTSTEIIDYIRSQHRDVQLNPIQVGKALTFLNFEHGQKMSGKFQVKGRWVRYIEQPEPPTSFPTTVSPYAGNYRVEKKEKAADLKAKNEGVKAEKQILINENDLPF